MINEAQWGIAPGDAVEWEKLEVSDPAYETGWLRQVTVKTEHLYGRADLSLLVPPELGKEPLPIIILLHGVYGSHWAWISKGGAQRTFQHMITSGEIPPCILAMPSDGLWGDGSGFLRHQQRDYGAWIARDVPAVVRKLYPQAEGGPLCLAGLSMGGFGALWLGALYGRSIFSAVSGFSTVPSLPELWNFTKEKASGWKLGDGADINLRELMKMRHDALPAIRFDCGTEDSLLAANRELSLGLKRLGVGHVYEEYAGGHNWEYWQARLPAALSFLLESSQPE
jgi:putative tributyrin esterase